MDVISSGNESDAESMSMDMLEDIRDRSQSRPIINSRKLCYSICDHLNKLNWNEKEN